MSQLDIILNKAKELKGSHEYDNYCQRFVRVCYEAAGITGQAASANEACKKWSVSDKMDNIPTGAAVYFKGIGFDGHVGICTGNGNIIHAANGVRIQSIDYCNKKYIFKGWGWQGGKMPEGASGGNVRSDAKKSSTVKTKTNATKGTAARTTRTIEEIAEKNLGGAYRESIYGKIDSADAGDINKGYELLIEKDKIYLPSVQGQLSLEYKRQLSPGALRFNVLKDSNIDFAEGSPVRLRVGGKNVFRGYVFEKSRQERDIISVLAYDSLRYFKNKDTVLYRNKKYSDLLKMFIKDYGLKQGDICDTGYVIEKQLEEGTLFDILANAADITYNQTGKAFTLLDDFGSICLRSSEGMKSNGMLDENNVGSFDYTSTIDREVYDYVQIAMDNKKQGVRNVYALSDDNTALWGRLQYYLKPNEELNEAQIRELAQKCLKRYSRKRRYLSLYDVKGDITVRGGSIVRVKLDLGDISVDEFMTCDRVKHRFFGKSHLMDIDLYGREGEFDV